VRYDHYRVVRRQTVNALIKLRDLHVCKYSVSVFVWSACINPMLQTYVRDGLPELDETPGVLYRDEWPLLYSHT